MVWAFTVILYSVFSGFVAQVQPRLKPPAAVAVQNRRAIASCEDIGCGQLGQRSSAAGSATSPSE
jgi:hypothetical protein